MKPRPPGQLRASVNPNVVMMICTAGHVDHGKTQLVKFLTGCQTDRLKAERERGLTIELGFAPCVIGGSTCVGIVDVPGHEKFVRTMIAGVSGIDMTILVVAADDGIMPQTVEHVQIMSLLGVRHGIVALTKTDLVAADQVETRVCEVRTFLRGGFLERAAICPVSSVTGAGFPAFYDTLVEHVTEAQVRPRTGVFRMPIERVFSPKGFGTVVTGIPVAGVVSTGDELELLPGGDRGSVRGIQCFLRDAAAGGSGQCLALNIPDIDRDAVTRGAVLCQPGVLEPAPFVHIRLTAVDTLAKPLRNAEEIKFLCGTTEERGKLYLLDDRTLARGQTALATVALANPIAAAAHDRAIVRRPSPATTVGGGTILAVSHEATRPARRVVLADLTAYEALLDGLDPASPEGTAKRVEHVLITAGPTGATVADIARAALLTADDVELGVTGLVAAHRAIELGGGRFIHADAYSECLNQVEARITRAGAEDKRLTLTVNELRQGLDWPASLWRRIQADLEREGVVAAAGDGLLLQQAAAGLSEADRDLMARMCAAYDEGGFHSPRPDELPGVLEAPRADVERLLVYLCGRGNLVRLNRNVILNPTHYRNAQDLVVGIVQEKGMLDSADFKYAIQSTRKYALAILDDLDARGVTVRSGNNRRLARDFERHLL